MTLNYKIRLRKSAKKEMNDLSSKDFDRVVERIRTLREHPRGVGCVKLRGYDLFRVKCGNFRIIYAIDDEVRRVVIESVGHRREVYRGL